MSDEIKLSLKTVYIGIALISLIIMLSLSILYINHNKKSTEIEKYKIAIYNSLICQFSCPIKDITLQNQTRQLPDTSCTKTCENKLKATNLRNDTYTESELLNDDLFPDIDKIITDCKKESTDSNQSLDYNLYYKCNIQKIDPLKDKYSYLR